MGKTSHLYDCLIIGGGHNGLVAAAYLARQGKKVCVLERRSVLGGCATTEELWPGFRISSGAYVISLMDTKIIDDLQLKQNGLVILPRNPSSFTPQLHGPGLLLGPDMDQNQKEISQFSTNDARQYPRYNQWLEDVAESLESILEGLAPDLPFLPSHWRRKRMWARVQDLLSWWRAGKIPERMGDRLIDNIRLLAGPATPILERWFESEPLKSTLATDAVIGALASPSMPGTAYVLLHHVMGKAGGARGIWGYVQGGMGELSESIARQCKELGVEIRRESPVRRILVHQRRVQGVELEDGKTIEAKCVASSVDARTTFLKFLGPTDLSSGFRSAAESIDYSSGSAKLNVVLGEAPQFTCRPGQGVAPWHRGTMHICESLDWIEQAYDDSKYGRSSTKPVLEVTMPTSVDTTLAPSGKHILNFFIQYVPYRLREGHWDEHRDVFAKRCLELLSQYAPNVSRCIEHYQLLAPPDLEARFGITGGNIMQGAMTPEQLFCMRPLPGWADHRTPIRGLYLCGAASHPGGGVMGICGRNAAKIIGQDYG